MSCDSLQARYFTELDASSTQSFGTKQKKSRSSTWSVSKRVISQKKGKGPSECVQANDVTRTMLSWSIPSFGSYLHSTEGRKVAAVVHWLSSWLISLVRYAIAGTAVIIQLFVLFLLVFLKLLVSVSVWTFQMSLAIVIWIIVRVLLAILFVLSTSKAWWMMVDVYLLLETVFVILMGVPLHHFYPNFDPDASSEYDLYDYEGTCPLPVEPASALNHLIRNQKASPFRILCLPPSANDDDIKTNYRKFARLVHPDKCGLQNADQGFKILDNAFKKICTSDQRQDVLMEIEKEKTEALLRKKYGHLFKELEKEFEELVNSLPCNACQGRHKKVLVLGRQPGDARYCTTCRARHPAVDGDVWSERSWLRLSWKCYACLDGMIYDVTDWGRCQDLESRLPDNDHLVRCRVGTAESAHTFRPTGKWRYNRYDDARAKQQARKASKKDKRSKRNDRNT